MTSTAPVRSRADLAPAPVPVVSVAPVVLAAPDRAVDLELRITAPVSGTDLPVVLLSHGNGPSNYLSSLHGYGPLVHFWASHGFVVVQPTHLDSMTLGLREADTPEAPLYWRTRATDLSMVLDRFDEIIAAVPALAGRVNASKVAAVGHSMGGHTVSLLLGARLTDPLDGTVVELADPRILAGVLLAAPGRGGDALTEHTAQNWPFFDTTDFSAMTKPALVVAGDNDPSPYLTVAGPSWHMDPYRLAPAPKSLLVLHGGEHGLGGVSGWDAAETTDEDPARVAIVQRLTWAYLRSQFDQDQTAWHDAQDVVSGRAATVEAK